jgi:hypothetical protein
MTNGLKSCQGEIPFIFCAFPLNFEFNLFVLHLAYMNPPIYIYIYIYIYMKNMFFYSSQILSFLVKLPYCSLPQSF